MTPMWTKFICSTPLSAMTRMSCGISRIVRRIRTVVALSTGYLDPRSSLI